MTYSKYTALSYKKIPEGRFAAFAARAEALLDKITSGRLISAGKSGEHAVAELAEWFYTSEKRGGIMQENNDGYSVVYAAERSAAAAAMSIARVWLPEEILYAGVSVNDC